MQKTILVLGGAGYIGSHTAHLLHQNGYKVVIIDKLLHGQSFDNNWADLIVGDFADEKILKTVFDKYDIEAVMHFAALIEVGISVVKPAEFYENNVVKTLHFLNFMLSRDVKNIIFSSTCAIYGNPVKIPMNEKHPFAPISPYGKNKLTVEFALEDYSKAYDLNYVSLRYFNAAGSDFENGLGEQHDPETHIIPLMLRAIKNNKTFKIFGSDYNSPDGTCVRDYIHVKDLAKAHLLALNYIFDTQTSNVFNLGTGTGFSVKEMIEAAENVCGQKMDVQLCERRLGDVDTLIADNKKIKNILGWEPIHSNIKNIVQSAWRWEHHLLTEKETVISAKCHSNKSSWV